MGKSTTWQKAALLKGGATHLRLVGELEGPKLPFDVVAVAESVGRAILKRERGRHFGDGSVKVPLNGTKLDP